MASPQELSDFLKSAELKAFKRTVWQVRADDAALDIVQDSMMKLAEHYGHKPVAELPLIFARILANATMDWFRQRQRDQAVFVDTPPRQADDEAIEWHELVANTDDQHDMADPMLRQVRAQTAQAIEAEVEKLSPRQREAFLLRYWEDLSVAETATAMGVTEGSVKVHCFRAVQTLAQALSALRP